MKGNDNLKKHLKRTEGISSRRIFITALTAAAVLILGAVLVLGVCLKEQALTTDFTRKNIAPCIQYPFGTDWMGRDMFVRTLTAVSYTHLDVYKRQVCKCLNAYAEILERS